MENTVIPKEKSQNALYFKHRSQIAKFTTPVAEGSDGGVRRDWVNPKTMEKGHTNEIQLDKIGGEWIDARIHTQEWEAKEGQPARTETSLLLALDQDGLVRVLKLNVFGGHGLSSPFTYFAKRCETIDPTLYTYFESWMPPNAEYAVLLYKQDVGEKWPQTRKCNYWNRTKEAYEGLPELVKTPGLGGKEEIDSKERDKYLYGLVEEFCKKVQGLNQNQKEQSQTQDAGNNVPESDEDVPF